MVAEKSDLEQRLAYLDLGQGDLALLAELRPLLKQHAASLVGAFYRHLLSFGPTRALLRDPAVKDRLLAKQREYLLSLGGPTIDEEFAAERRHIGEVHERIGLEPTWYLGAYALYQSLLTPVIAEAYRSDPGRGTEVLVALQKLLTFDAQLAMETYIERRESDRQYLTEELAREGRRLAHDYDQQTSELRVTRQRAQSAEELASIATLVAGLAHEIGTPMGVIQGHAKLLERAVEGADARWRLQTIQQQIERISGIIQSLLNMARPHARRRVPVALGPLLETTLSFISEKLARRKVQEEREIDAGVPSVAGDPERLQQVFLNLFLNAADAMPEGGKLRVSLRRDGEGAVEVRVADTGKGISEPDLPRIFEPFFTTKSAGQGHGLGLMVVQGIVDDHGGEVEVKSRDGHGTEFRIRLPVRDAGAA